MSTINIAMAVSASLLACTSVFAQELLCTPEIPRPDGTVVKAAASKVILNESENSVRLNGRLLTALVSFSQTKIMFAIPEDSNGLFMVIDRLTGEFGGYYPKVKPDGGYARFGMCIKAEERKF